MLNPEGLAKLGRDFTGKYSIGEIASQVTVLTIWKGTDKKDRRFDVAIREENP